MYKIKRFDIRLTEKEFDDIVKISSELNLTKSQFILNAIKFANLHRKEFEKI